jgi:hypothetical protein
MKIFGLILLLAGPLAFASNTVKLDMKLTLNGKTENPSVITRYGQAATISQKDESGQGYEILVTPQIQKKSASKKQQSVNLDFSISEIKDNVKKMVSAPKITVLLGDTATITQGDPSAENLKLEVTPNENL